MVFKGIRLILSALLVIPGIILLMIATPVFLLLWGFYMGVASLVAALILGVVHYVLDWPLNGPPINLGDWLLNIAVFGSAWIMATVMFAETLGFKLGPEDPARSHGSARFANKSERAAYQTGDGLLIGRDGPTGKLLRYDGPAHLLTLAPTRAGKGVGTVIPNLLTINRSVLMIDPKGENARIAGEARRRFGPVHILDPFGVTGLPAAAYTPLDRLSDQSPDLGEDAASLAEALVMDPPGQVSEAHWNEEAKALLTGLIMFAVAHEAPDRKTLATVREYLTLPPDKVRALLTLMQDSTAAGGLIARSANRFIGKSDREAASVLSSAQRHTHFLDSPRIVASMARSDVQFADLRHQVTSVFLVLPPNRLDAYSRWLRLLVAQALQDIARDAEHHTTARPDAQSGSAASGRAQPPIPTGMAPGAPQTGTQRLTAPALFLLDEFAALGRLQAVERAMGLMAGYGLQLWPILQDMSQLKDLYGARANTFVANAGVLQCFGVNDFETAKWLSQMIGRETTSYQTESQRTGEMASSTSTHLTARDLMTPDEIMQIAPDTQLLRVQGRPILLAQKLRYFADKEFDGLYPPQTH